MSVPTTGFLSVNTNQPPVDFPLPVADEFSYADGEQGTFTTPVQGTVVELDDEGEVSWSAEAGLVGSEYGFIVRVQRNSVFSTALIDSIDPPAPPEIFTGEDSVDVDEEIEPCPHNFEVDDYEVCCDTEDAFFWLLDGTVTLDGSRKWGTLA